MSKGIFDFEPSNGKDRGRCLGYQPEDCKFCGRQRVEAWENGQKICEKCLMDQDTGDYQQDMQL